MNLLLIFTSVLVVVNASPASERFRRDVSHLDLSYLPPSVPQLKNYLPPVEAKQSASPSKEYLPPTATVKNLPLTPKKPHDSTSTISDAELKAETLPPTAEIKMTKEIDIEQPELPRNEYLPPINTGEDISEIPLEPFPKNSETVEIETKTVIETVGKESSGEIVESLNVTPQDTAVKEADGYYYKKPNNIPDLVTPIEGNAEYLPPLVNVAVEGPANE